MANIKERLAAAKRAEEERIWGKPQTSSSVLDRISQAKQEEENKIARSHYGYAASKDTSAAYSAARDKQMLEEAAAKRQAQQEAKKDTSAWVSGAKDKAAYEDYTARQLEALKQERKAKIAQRDHKGAAEIQSRIGRIEREMGMTTRGRIVDAAAGTVKQYGASMGSMLTGLYSMGSATREQDAQREMEEIQRRLALMEQGWQDYLATGEATEEDRLEYEQAMQSQRDQLARVQKVLRAQKGTVGAALGTMNELELSAQWDIEQSKKGLDGFGKFVVDTGVAGSQMLMDAALGGGAATIPMAGRVFGGGYQEATRDGATNQQALAYGAGSAAVSVLTEKLANVAAPFKKFYGGGWLDDVISKATGKLGASAPGRLALSAISEAGEEFLEALVQPVLQRATYNKDAQFDLSEALYSALIGAALGGIGGTVELMGGARAEQSAEDNPLSHASQDSSPARGEPVVAEPMQKDAETILYEMAQEMNQTAQEPTSEPVGMDTTPARNAAQEQESEPLREESAVSEPEVSAQETLAAMAREMYEAEEQPQTSEKAPEKASERVSEPVGEVAAQTENAKQEPQSKATEPKDELAERMTKAAFDAGREGVARDAVELVTPEQEQAYLAGRQEQIMKGEAPAEAHSEYTPAGQGLHDTLSKLDRTDINGLRFTVAQDKKSGKFYGNIKRIPGAAVGGVPIENARSTLYSNYSKGFATREEALADLVEVAQNNGLISENTPTAVENPAPVVEKVNTPDYTDSKETSEGGLTHGREERSVGESTAGVPGESGTHDPRGTLERGREAQGNRKDVPSGQNVQRADFLEKERVTPANGTAAHNIAEQADREYGIETVVANDVAWERAFSDRLDIPAYSHDGKIYVREGIQEEDAAEVVPHEATHIMRQLDFSPYMEFLSTMPDRLNFASADSRVFLNIILSHLTLEENGTYRPMEIDDIEADEANAERFYDEVNAAIYGYYANGVVSGDTESGTLDLRNVVYDFDTYIQELSDIHQQFKNSRKGGTTPQRAIAEDVLKYIQKGQDFTAARLFEIADKHFGGTMAEGKYTVKDAYDAMELAVNLHLVSAPFVQKGNGNQASARVTLKRLMELLKHIPTQTKRTAEQESFQQFSTPPNIAYLAAWAANVDPSDVVLEPSAGIGGLALWPKAWGAKVYGNELSERRLAFLNELGLDGTFNHNAEQIDNLLPESIKPSVVVMNPPFSATAGRTSKNDTANAKRHIQQALDRLQEGGRLVAILGNGMADDAPAFRSWWNELRRENSIRANIRLDGENYRKYGTTFDVQMVVIDKTGAQTGETVTGTFKDLAQVPGIMEGIRNDRTRTVINDMAGSGQLSEPVLEPGVDSGTHADGGDAAEHSGGKTGRRNASRAEKGADQGRGKRGSRGGLLQSEGTEAGVHGVSEAGEPGSGLLEENAGKGRGTDGNGAVELELDRSAVKAEAVENADSVYSSYVPKKARITGARKHQAKLVESAAMAAVEPPDVTYTTSLPKKLVKDGLLSDAQLENIIYAGQAHEQMLPSGVRKGYFIGDGTGVGKGRQLSGIIMDNFQQGRDKAVWISNSANLYEDAIRDWTDLGGRKEDVLNLGKIKLGQDIKGERGILYTTYDTLKVEKDGKSRLKDLERWLGKDFEGVICFDEAHNMANAAGKQGKRGSTKPAAKALAGIKLQQMFPKARVVYASATGATDISDYAYLERLGLWGPGTAFHNARDFTSKISTGGLAAMELVARDMKSMGVYMARSISYDDVTYDTIQHDLNPMQTEIYNTMSRAWQTVFQNINKALEITGANLNGNARGAAYSVFFGTQQRFYNQIITSMSMPSVIEDMRRELDKGRSCILQIVNTNEAQADRAISKAEKEGKSLDDLDLTPSETLVEMVRHSFPVHEYEEYTDENGNLRSRQVLDGNGMPVESRKAVRMRDELIADLQQMKVPDGPLEMLFDAFGVDNVAEVTGRGRRVVEKADEHGQMRRVVESRSGKAGIADAQMFQDGKKRILVFSDAGGTGKSYHADLRAKNQQQRVHYLLQPGWNASKATQGFGRSHRSNQAVAPIFRLVTTNVMGQKRFTSTIARRLDQLGALTKGQRQAGSGIFGEKDNLEGPIAQDALQQYYKGLSRDVLQKLGLDRSIYDSSGKFNDGSPDLRDIGKFLNRILSLEVEEQNEVFQGFYDTFDRMMDIAIANGTVDMGLENYRADKIEVKDEKVIRKDKSGADTKYVQMQIYNKPELVSLAKAKKRYQNFQGIVRTEDGSVRAVYEISSRTDPKTGEIQRRFKLEGPVKGKTSVFVENTLKNQTKPIDKDDWADAWKEETAKVPKYNESTLHLLTGTLLPIWDRLPANNTRVMRVLSSDGKQYLGRVIRADEIDSVLKGLGANRTMQTYTPSQVVSAVLSQGREVVFRDNKLRLTRRRVSGEWRMELTGPNVWYLGRSIPGLITERINYEYRYFVPTGERGEAILAELMKLNPVVDIRDSAPTGDVDYMLNGAVADHSDEWTAKRVGDANKTPMRLSELLAKIRQDFGLNITYGHIRGAGIRGQYDRHTQGVRLKIAQDLPTVAHELGHHLDASYGLSRGLTKEMKQELLDNLDTQLGSSYSKKEQLGEAIAEYVRKFLQNRETAAIDYPQFTDYFLGIFTGKDLSLIEQLADEVNAYYALDADTATSSVRLREEGAADARTVTEKLKAKASVLAQAWLDSNRGIKEFDRATGANTYKLATNAAYSDAMAGQIIVGDLTDANGAYVGPGLKTALHGLNLNDEKEYRLFGEYLTVKHGPERLAEGMRIFADDRKNSTAFMQRRAAELEAQYPQFEEIAKRLYVFQQQFLQTWGVDTGLVSSVTAQEWHKRWKFYVPLNRAVSPDRRGIGARRGFANQDSTIKRAHGSGLDIVHPVDNIVNNLVKMVNAGVRNNVMREITKQAASIGDNAVFLEQVPTPLVKRSFDMTGVKEDLHEKLWNSGMDADSLNTADQIVANLDDILDQYGRGKAHGDVITVMKGGDQQFWKINDPLLLSSLTHMSQKNMEGILDAYAVVSRFMTSNITGNNIVWSLFSNFPRDMMTMFTYSKTKNPAKIFAGLGSAYVNKAKGDNADPLYKEFLAMGGGKTSAYTADRDLAKKSRKALSDKKISANPLDWITFVSDTVELGPRYATYKLMRQAGMKPQEAFYEAMDITVNFRRGGQVSRELNKVIPFFNASVQGLDKFRRWITAEDAAGKAERKKAVLARGLTYLAVSGALAAIFYAINNGDDEKEKDYEQLSSYTKNSFWNIPLGDGKFFAIPKPRELGVLSSFFETCMEYGIGENDHAFDEFYSYASENFLPSVASDIAQVGENGLVETGMGIIGSFGMIGVVGYLGANRDFLGRPIVSSGLQSLEPKDQYTERTSKIAYWMGQAFNASPTQIDYFFQQVLGGWWKAQKALFPVGSENVDYTLGVRNTYVKDNQYSQDLVNWMYDKADESARAKKSDPTNMEKAVTAAMDSRMTDFYGRYYKLAKNKAETTATRATRQTVMDMILEYRKASDTGSLTAAQRAVYELCRGVGNTDNLPAVMPVEVKDGNGRKHALSDLQYVEYQTEYNRLYWEYVEENLLGAGTRLEKNAVLKAARDVAKTQATDRVLARMGAAQSNFSTKYAGVSTSDVITFEAQKDLANDDGGLKQEEVIDIIGLMVENGLDFDDAYTLFHSKYESDKNNPWRQYKQ